MSTETESEFDDSSDTLCAIMHIENSTKRRERSEMLASYFAVAVIAVESATFALGQTPFARWAAILVLCLYLLAWLGRARTYRKRLMELSERHREVLNE